MFQIEISKCRYSLKDLDVRHMWPTPSMQVEEGPILVTQLDNGEYYVEDGRHRLIRKQLHGGTLIDAEWYDDWLDDKLAEETSAAIKKVLEGPFGRPVSVEREATREDVRRNLSIPHSGPTAMGYPRFGDRSILPPYDAVVLQSGEVRRIQRPQERQLNTGEIVSRGIPTEYKAKCGRDHLHEAHYCGEHMEDWCNGHPAAIYSHPRYTASSPKAYCGKFYRHDPHGVFLAHPNAPEDWCDGIPK